MEKDQSSDGGEITNELKLPRQISMACLLERSFVING